MNYINEKIYGVPKPLKKGARTSKAKKKGTEYIHKVTINGSTYYKVHVKRQGMSKIKYFKNRKSAKLFVDMLRINKYL